MTQYDQNGQEVQILVLQSVIVTPNGQYKPFSEMKRMKYIWELYGEIIKLGIIQLNNNLVFYSDKHTKRAIVLHLLK